MSDKKLSFEEAYQRLEKIADKLNSSDLPLDEAVNLYEEGIKLSKYCADALEAAKQKIETLKGKED